MIMRAIDSNGDWQFGRGTESYVAGELAIGENIKTRILSFFNNCFFDMTAGIDWFTYFGIPGQQEQTVLRVRAVILQSYGVVKVNRIILNINANTRQASLTYNISTIYSPTYQSDIQVINYAQSSNG